MPSPAPRSPELEPGPSGGPRSLGRSPDFRGLRSLLDEGVLADLTLVLRGPELSTADEEVARSTKEEVRSHRAVLAGVSDVLRAKFAGTFSDAGGSTWEPEVGSAEAWHWTLRWIYGHEDPLPPSLLVEVLLLADHFQIESLSSGILAYAMDDMAEEVVCHLLQAWACPEVLGSLARRCVPLVVHSTDVWNAMWDSPPQNVALFARFVPVLCEMDRLRLLCAYVLGSRGFTEGRFDPQERKDEEPRFFPDCLLSAVGWDAFPVEVLEGASRDDITGLEELTGLQHRPSQVLRDTMRRAIARRCQALELQVQGVRKPATPFNRRERADMYLLPLGGDIVRPPNQIPPSHGGGGVGASCASGLFARLVGLGLGVQVKLSSLHSRTPRDKARLFDVTERGGSASAVAAAAAAAATGGVAPSPPPPIFGTGDQSEEDQPWIEVFSKDCEIRPIAIGLRHGWYDSHYCKAFIFEATHSSPPATMPVAPPPAAASGGGQAGGSGGGGGGGGEESDGGHGGGGGAEGEWTVLLTRQDHALTAAGEIFNLDGAAGEGVAYDRFRIRMTAPNLYGSWHLMVNWLDVFGQFKAKASYFTGDGCRVEATL